MRPRSWVAMLAAGVALTAPRMSRAQTAGDVSEARAVFVEASKMAGEGRWERALELYEASYRRRPAAITRYSLGVAQLQTKRFAEALRSFRAFLAETPTASTSLYVPPARAALDELEPRVAKVNVSIEPRGVEGVTLTIDGVHETFAPGSTIEVDPGTHNLRANAPGYREARAEIRTGEGATTSVAMSLSREERSRTVPLILVGSGLALAAAGVTLGTLGALQAGGKSTPDSDARAKGVAGAILGGVGVATAGLGLGALLLPSSRSDVPAPVTVSFIGTGASLKVRF